MLTGHAYANTTTTDGRDVWNYNHSMEVITDYDKNTCFNFPNSSPLSFKLTFPHCHRINVITLEFDKITDCSHVKEVDSIIVASNMCGVMPEDYCTVKCFPHFSELSTTCKYQCFGVKHLVDVLIIHFVDYDSKLCEVKLE